MIKKIKIILLSSIVLLVSCTKDLTELNDDSKSPKDVPATSLFTNAQRNLATTLASANVNLNTFRLFVQHWQQTTYVSESRYQLNTRGIPDNLWTSFYRDVLRDLVEARALVNTQTTDAKTKKNQLAQIDIMEIYTYYYLISIFGDVPYTEAMQVDAKTFPKYDDARTIYNDLLTRLDGAIAALDPTGGSFGTSDVIYNGNVAKWKKFAASIKLKMGMTIADVDNSRAKTVVESAVSTGVFTSNADNALFVFAPAPPNTNPVWVDLVQSGRRDFVAGSTLVDIMNDLDDPRRPLYFTVDAAGEYSGGSPGRSSNYGTFSKPHEKITTPQYPHTLLDYSEVEFLLAEAVERGYAVGGTAMQHYNNAITASVLYWGGTTADAVNYLAQPEVNYATAAGDWREKIGVQKWIALYNRGIDAWIEWKRLDAPELSPAFRAVSAIPVRLTYPINEQNYNTANYNQAASAIGGDRVTTKVFWDVR